LLYNKQAAFIGATLCSIIELHGYAVRLFSVLRALCEKIFKLYFKVFVKAFAVF